MHPSGFRPSGNNYLRVSTPRSALPVPPRLGHHPGGDRCSSADRPTGRPHLQTDVQPATALLLAIGDRLPPLLSEPHRAVNSRLPSLSPTDQNLTGRILSAASFLTRPSRCVDSSGQAWIMPPRRPIPHTAAFPSGGLGGYDPSIPHGGTAAAPNGIDPFRTSERGSEDASQTTIQALEQLRRRSESSYEGRPACDNCRRRYVSSLTLANGADGPLSARHVVPCAPCHTMPGSNERPDCLIVLLPGTNRTDTASLSATKED